MKQQKKRNKKYNPRKSFGRQIANSIFISFESESEDGDKVCVTNIASTTLRDAVIEYRGDWLVQVGVIYQMPDHFDSKESYIIARGQRINDLTEHYQAEKQAIIESANANITVDFGWVIRPYSKRLERQVDNNEEKSVLDHWLRRRKQFEHKTLQALEGIA